MPGAGGDHIPIEANGARRADLGEDEHVPVQEREECDTRTPAAAPDPTVTRMSVTRAHIGERCHGECVRMHGDWEDQRHTTTSAG